MKHGLTFIARDLGIHPSLLQTWRRKYGGTSSGKAAAMPAASLEDEYRRLRRENAALREDREILKKSRGVLYERIPMKYAFIEDQRTQYSVRRMCEILEVSPAGYYEWRQRPLSARAIADMALSAEIVRAHATSRRTYGRPRIHAELRAQGLRVGQKRIGRLMKKAGIAGVRPRRFWKTTDSKHALPIAENTLARQFDFVQIGDKNRVCADDLTYLPTREGWLYLAVVIDLVSRRVIGWSMQATMERRLVINALQSAIKSRRKTHGTLFHSDRGS